MNIWLDLNLVAWVVMFNNNLGIMIQHHLHEGNPELELRAGGGLRSVMASLAASKNVI
jgi:hypothetical protein